MCAARRMYRIVTSKQKRTRTAEMLYQHIRAKTNTRGGDAAPAHQSKNEQDSLNVEVVCGPLTMNEASFEAKVDGEALSLSAKEFKLLLVFAKNPERVYSREMLLQLVWDNAYVDERTVDVHMLRLRKQLQGTRAENLLQTVRGLGYRAHISE